MYTGNICNHGSNHIARPVYPCVYREHLFMKSEHYQLIGLSLCVQGTSRHNEFFQSRFRFIPVCTGNMFVKTVNILRGAVYPCIYREHYREVYQPEHANGLSLYIQGTLNDLSTDTFCPRFIPVYTGNTLIITVCFIIKIAVLKFSPTF